MVRELTLWVRRIIPIYLTYEIFRSVFKKYFRSVELRDQILQEALFLKASHHEVILVQNNGRELD